MSQNQAPLPFQKPKKRAIVYIDGFNLYYGSVKGTAYKWLNLQRYFELLRNDDDVVQIHYFTALVQGSHVVNQRIYLQALDTLPKVNVVLGNHKNKRATCRVPLCTYTGEKKFTTWEEKRTDVNIAVQMMDDAYQNACDLFVVVSGDSDIVPPLYKIKGRFPEKQIAVYVPARDKIRGAATEIRAAGDHNATLPQALLKRTQFATTIPDGQGGTITKPSSW
jgi:uncharacterized LabA/DUF88 family protein